MRKSDNGQAPLTSPSAMTQTKFRPTFIRVAAVAALAASLAGCVDETRIREMTENLVRGNEAAFLARRAEHARDLATAKDCCDDLMKVRPHGRADDAQPFRAALGTWPSTQIVELHGNRSYYALLAFSPVVSDTARLKVVSSLSPRRYKDAVTGLDGPEMFVPVVAFLDGNRQLLEVSTPRPPNVESPTEPVFHVNVPRGAAFAAIHTTPDALALTGITALFPGGNGVLIVRGVAITSYVPPHRIALLPARVGGISVSME